MQSVFFGNSGHSAPISASSGTHRQSNLTDTSASPILSADEIRFGSHPPEPDTAPQQDDQVQSSKPGRGDRFKHALREAKAAAFNKKDLKKDLLWSVIITVLTCWAPGSQLITIPLFLAGAMAFRAILAGFSAYRHPERTFHRSKD